MESNKREETVRKRNRKVEEGKGKKLEDIPRVKEEEKENRK